MLIIIKMETFSNQPKNIENRTFSEIPGFSFEYPVFKEWEVKEIKRVSENEFEIFLNYPDLIDFYTPPKIKIKKDTSPMSDYFGININKNNVYYDFLPDSNSVLVFYQNKVRVTIDFSNIIEDLSFSRKALAQKIINTFRFDLPTKQISYIGVRYVSEDNNPGMLTAYDEETNIMIWKIKIYNDTQAIIEDLKIENHRLIITNSKKESYSIDTFGAAMPPIIKKIK